MKRWRAFLRGAASVLDIGGALGPHYEPQTPKEAARADAEALASDWRAVGDTMRQVMDEMDTELEAQQRTTKDNRNEPA